MLSCALQDDLSVGYAHQLLHHLDSRRSVHAMQVRAPRVRARTSVGMVLGPAGCSAVPCCFCCRAARSLAFSSGDRFW